jgi:hypothetical protein
LQSNVIDSAPRSEPVRHGVGVQLASQPSPLTSLPSSHSSPATTFRMPSPHREIGQFTLHVIDGPAPVSHGSPADHRAVLISIAGNDV